MDAPAPVSPFVSMSVSADRSAAHEPAANAPALHLVRDPAAGLPSALSSLVGRDVEVAEVERLLAGTRLLTLTGAGGSGKTRLALAVAERRERTAGRRPVWVELAPLGDAAGLAGALLAAAGERPHGGRDPMAQAADAVAAGTRLLVLDNCEHLLEPCAHLADRLLRAAPELRILATSREALGVAGETAWPVPTLAVPTADALARGEDPLAYPAVALFAERARTALPTFAVTAENAASVAEICRRLDGLPLAIELAAARVRALAPAQLAARLDDCFRVLGAGPRTALPRQQTLRATVEWSHALLPEPERLLLARLAVFGGGWTLDAAEAVCADELLPAGDVLGHLASLVDRSLVVAEQAGTALRYRFLEAVRQYALERLGDHREAEAVRGRHARHFAAVAETASREMASVDRAAGVERVRPELENLRLALRWSRDADPETHVRLAAGLGWGFFALGLWVEGRSWLEGALALPAGRRPQPPRARMLADVGFIANYQRDLPRARQALEEASALWAALDRPLERAHADVVLGQVLGLSASGPELGEARRLLDDALAVLRRAGDVLGSCWALASLGGVHLAERDPAGAAAAFGEALVLAREVGQPVSIAVSAMGLGLTAMHDGDLPRAGSLLREALAAHRREPEFNYLSWTLEAVAMHAAARGRLADAARLVGADEALRHAAGAPPVDDGGAHEAFRRTIAALRQALGAAGYEAAVAAGRRLPIADGVALAESLLDDEPSSSPAVEEPAGPPPPLRIATLGRMRVERDGAPVPHAAWKYAKARELLHLLLCHPAGRTREQIGVALWPEASAEQLRQAFHPVLHQLRRVLGGAAWVRHEGGVYRLARDRGAVVDVDELRVALDAADAAREPADAVVALARATSLYAGDFLEQDPPAGDWHLPVQDELRRRHEEALARLARLLGDLGRHAEAADAWRRLVARDPLDEPAARGLLASLLRLGDHREARRVYARLADALRAELDAEPSPETAALMDAAR